jgi:hypothetical protein
MRQDDQHPDDRELLLSLDGELPARDQRLVARHLTSCGACRDRRNRLVHVSALVAERQRRDVWAQEGAFLIQCSRARLAARLDEAASHVARPNAAGTFGRLQRLAVPAAIAAVAVAAMIFVGPWRSGSPTQESSETAAIDDSALPIPTLTPGATWTMTATELCAVAAARERQEIPAPVRDAVLRSYGMTSVSADDYELDYLITPELGGSPDARNLWPQRYASGIWNAYVKDQLEDLLPRMVCEGEIPLRTAQQDIAVNWIAAYKRYFHTNVPLPKRLASTTSGEWPAGDGDRVRSPLWRAGAVTGPRLAAVSAAGR